MAIDKILHLLTVRDITFYFTETPSFDHRTVVFFKLLFDVDNYPDLKSMKFSCRLLTSVSYRNRNSLNALQIVPNVSILAK